MGKVGSSRSPPNPEEDQKDISKMNEMNGGKGRTKIVFVFQIIPFTFINIIAMSYCLNEFPCT
jgi:hypothetical protein